MIILTGYEWSNSSCRRGCRDVLNGEDRVKKFIEFKIHLVITDGDLPILE